MTSRERIEGAVFAALFIFGLPALIAAAHVIGH